MTDIARATAEALAMKKAERRERAMKDESYVELNGVLDWSKRVLRDVRSARKPDNFVMMGYVYDVEENRRDNERREEERGTCAVYLCVCCVYACVLCVRVLCMRVLRAVVCTVCVATATCRYLLSRRRLITIPDLFTPPTSVEVHVGGEVFY